jgi:cytochrome c biogenesis protein CcmG, thiol:disulfide interchange protein DsbE
MRRAAWLLVAVAVAAVVVIGLRQAGDDKPKSPTKSYDIDAALQQLEGAPAPLAALHAQAGDFVEGGPDALREQLHELRGHPVVINKWASWCSPCRAEFPVFQRAAARKGKTVAFLGVDGVNPAEDAREFVDEFPVPYPSFVDDGQQRVAQLVGLGAAPFPLTAFLGRDGEVEFVHAGQYRTVADLEADIKRYLDA